MRGLAGKVIIVAGAGSGIGAASAIRLGEEGAKVVVGDWKAEAAASVAEQIQKAGGTAVGCRFDISEPQGNADLVACARAHYGRLDGIHINAADMGAVLQDTDVESLDMAVFDRLITVNLRGHFLLAKAALPAIRENGGGPLVFTSSTVAFVGLPNYSAYPASKIGINVLVRHIATTWGKAGVRANAVAPGFVMSDYVLSTTSEEMRAGGLMHTPSTRLGEPRDIAAMAAFLLSDDAYWINGQIIAVDGGATMRQ